MIWKIEIMWKKHPSEDYNGNIYQFEYKFFLWYITIIDRVYKKKRDNYERATTHAHFLDII